MKTRITLAGLLLVSSAAAAQRADPEHTPGTLKVINEIPNAQGLTAAQRAAASAEANGVIVIIRRNPALANPVGSSVTLRVAAFPRLPGDAPGIPYHVILFGQSRYFEWRDDDRGGRTSELGQIGLDFTIGINTAGYAAEMENDAAEPDRGPRIMGADEGGDIYPVTGTFRGRPIYGGSCTYLSHRTTAPIVPVSKERYLNVELLKLRTTQAHHDTRRAEQGNTSTNDQLEKFIQGRPAREEQNRKMLASLKQAGADSAQIRQAAEQLRQAEQQQEAALRKNTTDGSDQRMQDIIQRGRAGEADRIAKAQADIDALSPAERKSPASLIARGRNEFSLASADDSNALPLMQPNPAFYDASLGAGAPQLLWICAYHFQGVEDKSYELLAEGSDSWRQEKAHNERRIRDVVRFRDQLDWSALDALIKP